MCARQLDSGIRLRARHRAAHLTWCVAIAIRSINVIGTDEPRFCLWANESREWVWWLPARLHLSSYTVDCPKPGIMVWKDNIFGQQTVFLHIARSLTADQYVNHVFFFTVIRPLGKALLGTLFQQESTRLTANYQHCRRNRHASLASSFD